MHLAHWACYVEEITHVFSHMLFVICVLHDGFSSRFILLEQVYKINLLIKTLQLSITLSHYKLKLIIKISGKLISAIQHTMIWKLVKNNGVS